jgi:hypothetical protein
MDKIRAEFANVSMPPERAGVPPKPAVIEREFNQRFWGKPITFHAARLWLRGETLPSHDRLLCLAEWLGVEPQLLRYGDEVPKKVHEKRKRWDEGIGYEEREIFDLFLKLPVPQRKLARELIVALARGEGLLPLRGSS